MTTPANGKLLSESESLARDIIRDHGITDALMIVSHKDWQQAGFSGEFRRLVRAHVERIAKGGEG